jgi:hypothetical protein
MAVNPLRQSQSDSLSPHPPAHAGGNPDLCVCDSCLYPIEINVKLSAAKGGVRMKTNPAYVEALKTVVRNSPYPRHMSMTLDHIDMEHQP